MFDRRIPLSSGAVLQLGGVVYKITEMVGRGSNAMVYSASYEDNLSKNKYHSVLIKELFPLHGEGLISRDESGCIQTAPKAMEFFDLHKKSFIRGNAVNLTLQEIHANQVSVNINSFEAYGTLYSVLGDSDGLTLEKANEKSMLRSLKDVTECVLNILDSLKLFHHNKLLHLDISPDNILMLYKDPKKSERFRKMMLIDYNSTFSMEELTGSSGTYYSVKEPYSAPEVIMKNIRNVCPATDLFSICAIFFEYIAERSFVSSMEMLETIKSFRSDTGMLKSVPDTVRQKAIAIARRGLSLSPDRRYQSIEQFEADLQELHNRIEGVGVTHSSLWEASLVHYKEQIRKSPAFAYMFGDQWIPVALPQEIDENIVLTGDGGIGKTTFLLKIWEEGLSQYYHKRPVPIYIPLHHCNNSSGFYIRRKILESLKFDDSTVTVNDSLHKLDSILDGEPDAQPQIAVQLLLDGLNEVQEAGYKALLSEIELLSRKRAVRTILTSRNNTQVNHFKNMVLSPLPGEIVAQHLSSHGLLYPNDQNMATILSNPMMLSIYVKACKESQKNLFFQNADELLDVYLSGLGNAYQEKSLNDEAESAKIDYAVQYLLPRIAFAMTAKKQFSLSPKDMFELVEDCYREIKSKAFLTAFPGFIGKSTAILEGASDAEEWFGKFINGFLKSKLAFIRIDEEGAYCLPHQIFRDYFTKKRRIIKPEKHKTGFRRVLSVASISILIIAALTAAAIWLIPRNDNVLAKNANDISGAFKDASFLKVVYQELGINENEPLTKAETGQVIKLNVSEKNISSLSGIEYFTALEELNCSHNDLAMLDVSKNTALAKLYCNHNRLTTLNVSDNTRLIHLYCHDNQLTSLTLSKALTHISCHNNQLTDLDLSQSVLLTSLHCPNNQLLTLDITHNRSLNRLDCSNNRLPSENAVLGLNKSITTNFVFEPQAKP